MDTKRWPSVEPRRRQQLLDKLRRERNVRSAHAMTPTERLHEAAALATMARNTGVDVGADESVEVLLEMLSRLRGAREVPAS